MAHLDILVVMLLQHLQACGQVGLSAQTWGCLHIWMWTKVAQLAFSGFPLPVTVVPQGQWLMVPWLWACSSMHGCWSLRANSTVTVKFPRTWPPSDKVTRESANTHLCSSAGSERGRKRNKLTLMFSFVCKLFTESPWQLFVATNDVSKPGAAHSRLAAAAEYKLFWEEVTHQYWTWIKQPHRRLWSPLWWQPPLPRLSADLPWSKSLLFTCRRARQCPRTSVSAHNGEASRFKLLLPGIW